MRKLSTNIQHIFTQLLFFLSRQKFLWEVVFSVLDGVLRRFLRYAYVSVCLFMTKGLMGMWQYYVFDIYPKKIFLFNSKYEKNDRNRICMLLQSLSQPLFSLLTHMCVPVWSVIWANLNAVKFYGCVKLIPPTWWNS